MILLNNSIHCKEPEIKVHDEVFFKENFQDEEYSSKEKFICRSCNFFITMPSFNYYIDGSWEHFFTNPAHKFFHVRTFKRAPGCLTWGQYTLEYTWFKNIPWIYAFCGNCNAHLGWHYSYMDQEFFGLIADELKYIIEGDEL